MGRDDFRFVRCQILDRIELLRATYREHRFPLHYHDTYVVQIIEHGATAVHVDGESHIAQPGNVVVLNPHAVHDGRAVGLGWLTSRSAYPTVGCIGGMLGRTGAHVAPRIAGPVLHDGRLFRLLRRGHLAAEAGREAQAEALLTDALARLFARHLRAPREAHPKPSAGVAIDRALTLIDRAYAGALTLNDLAAEAGLSLFHFIRAFHRRTGLTPHEYLVNVRIKHARQLLASGLPIARVAFQTGFADQSHLTRRFRASVGVTPGRYRSGG